jgi:hypothetical protein
MFDREVEQIISTVRDRTIMKSSAIAVKEILAADIPHALKKYFRTEVELKLADELSNSRTASRFNWEHPEVKSLHGQINSILVLNFQFERNEYLTLLDDAVHLLLNYLVRPQWTLRSFLFEKEQSLSATVITRRLRYFTAYEYLKDLVQHYLREKYIQTSTSNDFSTILWKLDAGFIRRKSGEELANLMMPLYEFLDYPENLGTKSLPTKAILKYFDDKGLEKIVIRLEGEFTNGTTELSLSSLKTLLEELRRTEGPFEAIQPSSLQSVAVNQSEQNQIQSPQPQETQTVKPTPSASMLSFFGDGDRKRIVKKVFLHDEHAFFNSLQMIDNLTSWKEASAYVDEILIKNDVDPYSNEAKRFMEILYQRFFPKRD